MLTLLPVVPPPQQMGTSLVDENAELLGVLCDNLSSAIQRRARWPLPRALSAAPPVA